MTASPIHFSPNAIAEIQKLKNTDENRDKPYLRIGVKQGGCAGYEYIFAFDTRAENDLLYTIEDGLEILIDIDQALLIPQLEVDYESGLNNRGFIFKNPNAKTTCGCGQSFSWFYI